MEDIVILSDTQRAAVQAYATSALCEFDRLCKANLINYTLGYGTLIGAIRHKGFIPWDDDIDVCVSRKDLLKLRSIANNELSKGFFYQSHTTDKHWFRLYDKIRVDGTVFREIAHENESIHQGVYIDIFPLDFIPDNNYLAKCQVVLYKISAAILSSKYISLRYRHGFNKVLASILKVVFFPIRKKWLYNLSERIATCVTSGTKMRNMESPYNEVFPKTAYEKYVDVDFEKYKFPAISCYDRWLRGVYGDYLQLPPENKRVSRHALSELKLSK